MENYVGRGKLVELNIQEVSRPRDSSEVKIWLPGSYPSWQRQRLLSICLLAFCSEAGRTDRSSVVFERQLSDRLHRSASKCVTLQTVSG